MLSRLPLLLGPPFPTLKMTPVRPACRTEGLRRQPQPARALVFQSEDALHEFRSWLIDLNRGGNAKQLDEGIVDTFVLDDVFGE